MRRFRLHILTPLLSVVLLVCSCAVFKANPAPPSGYIENYQEMKPWKERAAFLQRIWFKDREKLYRERDKYTKIHFRPVRTDFLINKGWWDDLNSVDRARYEQDLREMAEYIKSTFDKVFTEDPTHRFEVVQDEDPQTIVYEIALVELVATKVHLNTIGTALGFVVPGGGLVKSLASGSIAIEVKAFDGGTQELLLAWADREKDQIAPVSVNEYSWYSNARGAVDSWAESLLEVYHTPATHKIEGRSPVTLLPF